MLFLHADRAEAAPGGPRPCRLELPQRGRQIPALSAALPDGSAGEIPGECWPALAFAQGSERLGGPPAPPVAVREASRRQANALLVAWEHPLGEYRRLYGQQHFVLEAGGTAVSVACSGSVRRPTVAGGIARRNVVELARIARHPGHPRAMRAMLRLWTDYLACLWEIKYPDWDLHAAISYALPGKAGNLYRFDGWERLGHTRPWGGSTGWSGPSAANGIADGRKTVWLYRYGSGPVGSAPMNGSCA